MVYLQTFRGLQSITRESNSFPSLQQQALMLENLQRTSTPHSGLQPNSQVGSALQHVPAAIAVGICGSIVHNVTL